MTDNQMRQAFLIALKQRAEHKHSSHRVTLPTGRVDTRELQQVLSALDNLPSDTEQD